MFCLDLLHASLLVWFDAGKESLDVIHFLGKFLLESSSFLLAEVHEMGPQPRKLHFLQLPTPLQLNSSTSVFVVTSGRRNRGAVPVSWLRNTGFSRNLLDLLVIILYKCTR